MMGLGNIKTESDLGNLVDGNDWDEDNEGMFSYLDAFRTVPLPVQIFVYITGSISMLCFYNRAGW